MKKSLGIIAALVFFVASFTYADPTLRVINGTAGFTATYPWMASIEVVSADYTYAGNCGGSLIAPDWVLTAAHCFLDETGTAIDQTAVSRTTVQLNSDAFYPMDPGGIIRYAKQVIIHPLYNPDYMTSPNENDYDMALVELSDSVSLQSLPLIKGTGTLLDEGTGTIVMGWGNTAVDGYNQAINPADSLLQAQQQIVSETDCSSIYGNLITGNMICAGGLTASDTSDTCTGDSGGPMVVATTSGFVQVGVVSFGGTSGGPICGDPGVPGVYTRISALNSFISQTVSQADFRTVTPLASVCTAAAADSDYTLSVACIRVNGESFSGIFTLTDTGSLSWQWNGLLENSACGYTDAQCAVLASDLSLTIPGISLGQDTVTLKLDYSASQSVNGKHVWQYAAHY